MTQSTRLIIVSPTHLKDILSDHFRLHSIPGAHDIELALQWPPNPSDETRPVPGIVIGCTTYT